MLPELLEVGESVLPFLPPHCKAALLARAKQQVRSHWQCPEVLDDAQTARVRNNHPEMYLLLVILQDLVDDRALRLLTDADCSVLDASNCARLTDEGLLTALRLAPDLRLLDITGCHAGAAVLRALPALCPRLEVLRLGKHHP